MGQSRQVHRWLHTRRRAPAPTQPTASKHAAAAERLAAASAPPRLPSPRQLAWLLTRASNDLAADEVAVVARIEQDAHIARVAALVRRFVALIRDRPVDHAVAAFDAWLGEAAKCGVRAVETFAAGLAQDGDAVRAAITTPWSNAQAEGHVTKLKLLKRQMYGRANFDLFRRRVLVAA